jgi:hypothetical protein
MPVQYVGPYSPEYYQAAEFLLGNQQYGQQAADVMAQGGSQPLGDILTQQAPPAPTGDVLGDSAPPPPDPGPDPFLEQINATFDPIMSFLGEAETKLRGQQPGLESEIEAEYGVTRKGLETERAQGERQLGEAGTKAEQRKADAMNAARRLFNEMTMGGRQRFGGASPVGEGFQALLGRELQRSRGGIAQSFETAQREIQGQLANLGENFRQASATLDLKKNQALASVRRAFEDRLLEIDRLRAEAESDKQAMRLEALTALRNQIHEINLAEATTLQQMQAQKSGLEQQLLTYTGQSQAAVGAGGEAVSGLLSQTTTDPTSALALGPRASQGQPTTFTGIKRDEEEDFRTIGLG